ncbi:hypothetical protein AAHC03_05531 [Spirometra sp. Aus1]
MNSMIVVAAQIILIVGLNTVKSHVLHTDEHHEGFEFSVYSLPTDIHVANLDYRSNCSISQDMPATVSSLRRFSIDDHHPDFTKFFHATLEGNHENISNVTALLSFGPGSAKQNLLLQISYREEEKHSKRPSLGQAILAGFLGVTITNMCSLFGAICIPVQKRSCYPMVLTMMIGLAVAALCSTALLVLLPEALDLHLHEEESSALHPLTLKLMTVLAGGAFFYVLEYIIMRCPKFCQTTEASENADDRTLSATGEIVVQDSDFQPEVTEEFSKTASNSLASTDNFETETKRGCGNRLLMKCNGERLSQIAPVAWMILFGDGVHNMMDGLTIGAGFTRSLSVGISLTISIMLEELPHEFGDFAILLSSGFSIKAALICNFLSACSAYVGLIIGLAVGEVPSGATVVFALTTGFFLYISLSDMLPEMRETITEAAKSGKHTLKIFIVQCFGLTVGFLCILAILLSEKYIEI